MLESTLFRSLINNAPLISIDLIVRNKESNILLGKRVNAPAKGFYFVPGGRIYKNETLASAFQRICLSELGINVDISSVKMLGVYEHFYDDSFFGPEINTHYVVLAYELSIDVNLLSLPGAQHGDYIYMCKDDIVSAENVHSYTQQYFSQKV
ncbi:MAG TPA: GDP-mannose mannosyl hydrolase [Scandinavium sp.]|jgi:colanic acid biosynthesis protein WcaH